MAGDTEVDLNEVELSMDEESEDCELDFEEEDAELYNNVESDVQEADVDTCVLDKVTNPTSLADKSATTIKYAPVVKPVVGKYNLYCIAIDWLDTGAKPLSSVKKSAQLTKQVYEKYSRGKLELFPIAKTERVRYKADRANLSAAIEQAKKQATAGQTNKLPNMFVMVTNDVGASHGSGDTVRVRGTLGRDFLHEVGHSKVTQMLRHSGRRLENGKVDAYGDGTCFMSSFSSKKLTLAQQYSRGWLPENQVAQYEGFEPVVYKVAKLDGPDIEGAVKGVRIPRPGKDPLFVSIPEGSPNNPKKKEPMLMLHSLYMNSGTVRERSFLNHAEYNDLIIDAVEKNDKYWTVQVSRAKISSL